MPGIVIVDTSVFLNVLDVPGRNQHRTADLARFDELIEGGINLLLPIAAVFEAGNHIAHIDDGGQRRRSGEVFRDRVHEALKGEAPWTPIQLPDNLELADWLDSFPESAMRGAGMGDLSIVEAWKRTCRQHPTHRVSIWTHDQHLAGYDRKPRWRPGI